MADSKTINPEPENGDCGGKFQVSGQVLRDLSNSLEGLVQMANWQVVLLKDAKSRLDEIARPEPPAKDRG